MKIKSILSRTFPKLEYSISNYGVLTYEVNYESIMVTSTDALFVCVTFKRNGGPEKYSVANRVLLEHYWNHLQSYGHYLGYDRINVSLGECEPSDCI